MTTANPHGITTPVIQRAVTRRATAGIETDDTYPWDGAGQGDYPPEPLRSRRGPSPDSTARSAADPAAGPSCCTRPGHPAPAPGHRGKYHHDAQVLPAGPDRS